RSTRTRSVPDRSHAGLTGQRGTPQSHRGSRVSYPPADDERWMAVAIAEARAAAEAGEVPVGAVVVGPEGEVVRSRNRIREVHDPTGHAEMHALRAAAAAVGDARLGELTLYVTLEPCAMCAGAIVLARL